MTKIQRFFSSKISWVAIFIIAIASILAIASAWNDSVIVDEVPHIGAGYSYLVKRDMRLNPEHPPLAKDLAAIPLLFLKLKQDVFSSKAWLTDVNGQWEFGRALIFGNGNNANLITHTAKIPMILFFILSAWIVFIWARKLYGDKAALFALILFSFSPTIMAHSRFVTTDMPAMFGVLSATYFFLNFLKANKANAAKSFVLAALFFGIALLLKFSTVLLIPFFILIWIIHSSFIIRHFSLKPALVLVAGFVFVVGPIYLLQITNYPPARQHADTVSLLASNTNLLKPIVVWASDKPVFRAYAQYGLGLLMVTQRAEGGNTVYYRGNTYITSAGHWYFPFVYLIKEPLAWLILLTVAIAIAIFNFRFSIFKKNLDVLAMLLWIGIYWAVSIKSNLNIGVRHLLPAYPFMIILVSGSISDLMQSVNLKVQNYSSKFKNFTVSFSILIFTFLIGWYVWENIKTFPYYLTYFNELAGGPTDGHRYVVDSNLDWGQDLKRLGIWVKENNVKNLQLDYFGWADQSYYLDGHFTWVTSKQHPKPGYFAVSATYLMNNIHGDYAWLADQKPVTVIGNSIFVYHL